MTITRTEKGLRGGYHGTFKVDPSRNPMTFDFTNFGPNPVQLKGICAFEGKTLKLCYRHSGDGGIKEFGRPEAFSAPAGSKVQFYVFRRLASGDQPRPDNVPDKGQGREWHPLFDGKTLTSWRGK